MEYRRVVLIVVVLGFGLLTGAGVGFGQGCPEVVGRVPGEILEVTVSGECAYLGASPVPTVATVSDPSLPWLASKVALPARDHAVTHSDGSAYVTAEPSLSLIGERTPWPPSQVGRSLSAPGDRCRWWRLEVLQHGSCG